jgi:hypothetical protein
MNDKRIPVVRGWIIQEHEQVKIWCSWCRRFHYHGAPGAELAPLEHRVCHCTRPDGPYHRRGYLIDLNHGEQPPKGIRPWTPAPRPTVRRRRRK